MCSKINRDKYSQKLDPPAQFRITPTIYRVKPKNHYKTNDFEAQL